MFIGLALLEGKIYFDLHKTLIYKVLSITVVFSKKFVLISFLSLQPSNPFVLLLNPCLISCHVCSFMLCLPPQTLFTHSWSPF